MSTNVNAMHPLCTNQSFVQLPAGRANAAYCSRKDATGPMMRLTAVQLPCVQSRSDLDGACETDPQIPLLPLRISSLWPL